MEKVAYILGAGFSAPLGLPLTNNFLLKSKDLYFTAPQQYKYFKEVFNTIKKLSVCKNYFDTDLFNIEEILSILEMGSFLDGKKFKEDFIKYIKSVILYYSSGFQLTTNRPGNWQDFIFGGNNIQSLYGYFVAHIFNSKIYSKYIDSHGGKVREFFFERINPIPVYYSTITLNYDLILEEVASFISKNYAGEKISFNRGLIDDDLSMPYLAKLHGSVDWDLIIPPTWAKGVNKNIAAIWKYAKNIIQDTNHIRFIGYSLPKNDTYVQYLLKSAIVNSEHLKSIDVICIDTDGSVRKRYNELINFNYYRFANANVTEYLLAIQKSTNFQQTNQTFFMSDLEKVHNSFMENHK